MRQNNTIDTLNEAWLWKRLNMITIFLYACTNPYNSVLPWKSLQTHRGSSQALDNSYRIRIPRTRYAMPKGYGDEPTISEKRCKVSEHRTFLYNKPVLLNALTRENCVGTGVAGNRQMYLVHLIAKQFWD